MSAPRALHERAGARATRRAAGLRLIALTLLAAPLALATPHARALVAAPATEAPTAEPAIAAERAVDEDRRISERIGGIFAEVPSLAGITATVEEGVVTLSGTVADATARARAEAIAARIQGVVTIENGIERDVSVDVGTGLTSLSGRVTDIVRMSPLVAVALGVGLLIAAFGYLLASFGRLWRRVAPNPFLADLIASAIRFVFAVGGTIVALDMIGAGALLGAVLGGAGVIGIALGFAMRETIENYVASLMLSVRQPFRPDDHVLIDQHEGTVVRLTSRATILMTPDGNHLRVPNAMVFKAVIRNFTHNPRRRFDFDLGIGPRDDPTAARALGVKTLCGLDFLLGDPEPAASLEEAGASANVIRFFGWIDQHSTDLGKARSQAIPAVRQALEEAGFTLPVPGYRLHVENDAGAPAGRPAPSGPGHQPVSHGDAVRKVQDTTAEKSLQPMVDADRAEADAHDLLDPAQPVE